jgi:hypothetical protein
MNETIGKIRQLLNDLESQSPSENEATLLKEFSALELPAIIKDIVDYLFPLLETYECVFYMYMFRISIVEHGQQSCRTSTRGMQEGVVQSARTNTPERAISLQKVQKTLTNLEKIGAIQKTGDTNREGTLYKIMLPEEIEQCRKLMQEKQDKEAAPVIDENKELDFYNNKDNRAKIFERDNWQCKYCGKQLTRFTATLDHVKPVSAGGGNDYENLLTACLQCNSKKNRKPLGDFMADSIS